MGVRSTADRYGRIAQGLHWATALLILALIPLGILMTRVGEGGGQTALYRIHVGLGLTVAGLTLARVVWRIVEPTPAPPPMPAWRLRLYTGVHVALYAGLAVLAISGVAMLVGSGMVPIPPDVVPADVHRDLAPRAGHQVTAYVFLGLFAAHIAGVASYQLAKGDVLARMGVRLRRRPDPEASARPARQPS